MKKMKNICATCLVVISICLLLFDCSFKKQSLKSIDLSGEWHFKLDKDNIGKTENWFDQTLDDTIILPGTTDENQKGDKNEAKEVVSLTRKYVYEGKAWYQREVDIPKKWESKTITLFLERTKATEVWVDGQHFEQQKSLISPHEYDLSDALSPGKHMLTISVDNTYDLFPVGGSHALASHTQTNWNGIIGKIELKAKDRVHITSIKLHPDVVSKTVKAIVQIKNPDQEAIKGKILCKAEGFNGHAHIPAKQSFTFSSNDQLIVISETYQMGADFATWDEFTPNLYKLSVSLLAISDRSNYQDEAEEIFGMLDFKTQGTQFEANGKTIMLRGKHDACVFPLTGYPPMTKEEWIRQMKISKSYGLNHYRFHSWTPPDAAFEAADIVGIYMQTELPNWRAFETSDTAHFHFQQTEGEKILDSYGNHPSMVLFALGNELGGDRNLTAKMVDTLKAYDSRCLFAQGSNNYFWDPGAQPNEDFFVSARTKQREDHFVHDIRASFSFADCPEGGLINGQFPNTLRTFEGALKNCKVPAIGHETGQYQVLPNFDETSKYKGVLEARNFEVFQQRMKDKNMFSYWKELYLASGKHAAICYKEDNEISMRTPRFGGFQILDLQDFPGQGTALVGVLDAFMDSKGMLTPEEWRQSCAAQTIQAEMPRFVWQNNEVFTAKLIAINYGASDMPDHSISWALSYPNGETFSQGKTVGITFKQGRITHAGDIEVSLGKLQKPQKLTLALSTKEGVINNQYEIWVYPVIETINNPNGIEITSSLDEATLEQLEKGRKVLFIPDAESIAQNSTGGLFISDYWCYPMFKQICENIKVPVSPGTLGLLIDDQHPVFEGFPTEFHSNWQWWSLMKNSYPIILDATTADYRPIVQTIDNFDRCSKLGLLFEFAVGEGTLLVCSADLSDQNDFVAQTLLQSILTYMSSAAFSPDTNLTPQELLSIFYGNG